MLKVYLDKDFHYVQSLGFQPEEHGQIAPQISLASPGSDLRWDGDQHSYGVFFPSGSCHAVNSDGVLHTYLINPAHPKARSLTRLRLETVSFDPPLELREALHSIAFVPNDGPELARILDLLFLQILPEGDEHLPLDPRIARILVDIDERAEKRVTAVELAARVSLSESRFLHLFKEEMGMTLRRYLMWRRTVEAATLVVEGASITEAAHATGFTDSAHFARVFKRIFGTTLSTALGGEPRPVLVVGNPTKRP